jgi:hypothetical protein
MAFSAGLSMYAPNMTSKSTMREHYRYPNVRNGFSDLLLEVPDNIDEAGSDACSRVLAVTHQRWYCRIVERISVMEMMAWVTFLDDLKRMLLALHVYLRLAECLNGLARSAGVWKAYCKV